MLLVSRIEVFGFKSFMERLVLPLGEGITGVVGPNGCGKSNIVDALRWVLGETRASQLRGDVLEDVIFNGTDSLRPLGLAEVTLTLRARDEDIYSAVSRYNQDFEIPELPDAPKLRVVGGTLVDQVERIETPTQQPLTSLSRFEWLKGLAEVQITRRLYRSGESEFFINKVPSRLKDIKDFVRAVGLGARSYTIVAQGEVSRIVTAKPEERRLILEDAAGILGLRDKIAEAERRLTETHTNLTRLNDVIVELERQVSSLKRQASRAKNRIELKTDLQQLETKLFSYQKIKFTGDEEAITASLAELKKAESSADQLLEQATTQENQSRNVLLDLDLKADGLRSMIDEKKERINSHNRKLDEKRESVAKIAALISAGEAEAVRLKENKEILLQRQQNSTIEIAELEKKLLQMTARAGSEYSARDKQVENFAEQLAAKRSECAAKEREIKESLPHVPFSRLADLITAKQGDVAAALSDLYFVSSVEEGKQYLNQNSNAEISLITAEGEIISKNKPQEIGSQIVCVTTKASNLRRLDQERQQLEAEYRELELQHLELLKNSQQQSQEAREYERELGTIKGELVSLQKAAGAFTEDIARIEQQTVARERGIEELKISQKTAEAELLELSSVSNDDDQGLLLKISEQFTELEKERKQAREIFDEAREKADKERKTLDILRRQQSQKELDLQKTRIDMDHITERFVSEFGEEGLRGISGGMVLSEEDITETREKIATIRNRIHREGDVDPTTIDQFEVESARLQPLIVQKDDLEKAVHSLKESIAKLRETSKTRFIQTFEAVKRNFQRLIPKLYGGGTGDLILLDPENPTETGVDILIRPPGKKPKSIELLSGGEKALCATALIFAMFIERPSPLCVLDEVDAPLDDANLLRFVQLVQEMTKDTQFMMITHNKQTMTAANDLVGVTMEQPGASRVITVSLQEALRQVA